MEEQKRVGRPTKSHVCDVCGTDDLDNFYSYRKNKCKKCLKTYNKEWETENILRTRLLAAKHRAIRKGLKFELTDECIIRKLIEQDSKCFISKVPLSLLPDNWDSISFDRLNNDLGYTIENTILVTKFVNSAKNTMDLHTFRENVERIYLGMRETL